MRCTLTLSRGQLLTGCLAHHLCMQLSVDIRTMKKEDATFRVPISLTANRNDFVHAIVAYFDIGFTHGHKPIWFSTSPK